MTQTVEIYPAIDLYQGQVVRLKRGDYDRCKVYSRAPKEIALRWMGEGARWLHVVDLDGARTGIIKEWTALEKILSLKSGQVQFGGGVRRKEDIKRLLGMGVSRVILGTKGLDGNFLEEVTKSHGRKIALSLDVRGKEVRVEGWLKKGAESIYDLLARLKGYPLGCLIVTDIERDGTLQGINLDKVQRILKASPLPVILSGGVGSMEDICSLAGLKESRLEGVIIGKALYEERIDLGEALRQGGN